MLPFVPLGRGTQREGEEPTAANYYTNNTVGFNQLVGVPFFFLGLHLYFGILVLHDPEPET